MWSSALDVLCGAVHLICNVGQWTGCVMWNNTLRCEVSTGDGYPYEIF